MAPRRAEMVTVSGIDALTGNYLLKPQPVKKFSVALAGGPANEEREAAARQRVEDLGNGLMKVISGVDDSRVDQAGWGIVFSGRPAHAVAVKAMRKHLEPLIEHRKQQAGGLFRIYEGKKGIGEESATQWMARHGVGAGSADPKDMPFFLLFAGPPDHIPFETQYRVDLQRAVGRLCFARVGDYRRYADHLVAAENGPPTEKRLELFGPRNRGDAATSLSMTRLIQPLQVGLEAVPGWGVGATVDKAATHEALAELVNRSPAALIMTAGHGMGYPAGHPDQLARQGALITADWPGVGTPPASEHTFAGTDVAPGAALAGRMAFLFACYGGGTPAGDDFAHRVDPSVPVKIAEAAFVAELPQRLLAGGMLAVMAHVDRAWSHSFQAPRAGEQVQTFQSTLRALMNGKPVGVAFDDFNVRTGELAFDLADLLSQVAAKKVASFVPFASVWTAATDARNYLVLGDPAARLKL
ncbi:MAG: hypothetical protein ACT4OM_03015 [Actinomycetota bacterium]